MPGVISEWFEQNLNVGPDLLGKLIATLVVVVALILLRLIVLAVVNRRTGDSIALYRWRKAVAYTSMALGVLLVGRIWLSSTGSLATYLGLLSAALVIALQDPISNIVGWGFLLWRRPFEVGDRIEIGEFAGDVIDLRIFQFTLMEIRNWVDADQSTGRVLHLPNKKVFSDPIANYSKGFAYIWDEMQVMVTFESDWRRAKEILLVIVERHAAHLSDIARERVKEAAQRYLIFYENLTPIVYTSVADSGVVLTLRYLVDPRQRRASEQAIWEETLEAFAAEAGIEFAYPTQRIYYNPAEGQPSPGQESAARSSRLPLDSRNPE
jgi:small-conductance mechanosensitive channel